jgi:hypothetical protein
MLFVLFSNFCELLSVELFRDDNDKAASYFETPFDVLLLVLNGCKILVSLEESLFIMFELDDVTGTTFKVIFRS